MDENLVKTLADLGRTFSKLEGLAKPSGDVGALIGPHPSLKTNGLLSEQTRLAESQLSFLIEEAKASRASAASTRRIAILANIIAAIAAIMATIAAIPPMIDVARLFIAYLS